jgi:two-component system, chemotaxis family, chemotaxis protein CheY
VKAEDRPAHTKVLIVDDVPELRNVLASFLGSHGYETSTAADGMEALSVLRGQETHVLVTDFNMPRLDGIGLIKAIYEAGIALKGIVMMSGGQRPQQKEEFDRFIREFSHPIPFIFMDKPLVAESLCATIQSMLGKSNA